MRALFLHLFFPALSLARGVPATAAAAAAAVTASEVPPSQPIIKERYGAVDLDPEALAEGLSPRYFLDRSQPLVLDKRDVNCGTTKHSCLDVGFDVCCDNDQYCYVDRQGKPRCCPIGSDCVSNNQCGSSSYRCTRTVTVSDASGTASASAEVGCCGRKCSADSYFLCPSDQAGSDNKCCPFGAACRAGGKCVSAAPTSTSVSVSLTPVAEGCTTSQYKCADGHGCCNDNQKCTSRSGKGYCAAGRPTGSNIAYVDAESGGGGGGLSSGAKAGIAVGVVVGVAIIAAASAWLCLIRKRRQRSASGGNTQSQAGTVPGVGDGTESRPDQPAMTETSAGGRTGLTQEYFGPAATIGPYTETNDPAVAPTSPGQDGAVPSHPRGPGDIAAPVEIGSHGRGTEESSVAAMSPRSEPSLLASPDLETIQGRFELSGMDTRYPLERSMSIQHTPPGSIHHTPPELPVEERPHELK